MTYANCVHEIQIKVKPMPLEKLSDNFIKYKAPSPFKA